MKSVNSTNLASQLDAQLFTTHKLLQLFYKRTCSNFHKMREIKNARFSRPLSVYRKSTYYRDFFLKKIYENFVGTLETVRNIEVSVPRGSTVFGISGSNFQG